MSQQRQWRLDVVTRAVMAAPALDSAQRKALSELLGIAAWSRSDGTAPRAEPAATPVATSARTTPSPSPAAKSEPNATTEAAAPTETPPERSHLYRLPDPDTAQRPGWLDITTPLSLTPPLAQTPSALSLIPHKRMRSVLGGTLKTPRQGRAVDVPALIQSFAKARPLRELPRLPDWQMAQTVHVIVDRSSAMTPFLSDITSLRHALARLTGAERLSTEVTSGWPSPERPAPHPNAVLLILSGFGLLPRNSLEACAGPRDWAAFGASMQRRGWKVMGMTPAPPDRWPDSLRRVLPLVHWAETTNARQAQAAALGQRPRFASARATSGDRLAQLAAMSARLDHAGVRRLRLMLGLGPEAEAQLWWSDHVGSRGDSGVTLKTSARQSLQQAFAKRQDAGAVTQALTQFRPKLPAQFAIEEKLIELLVLRPAGWQERAEAVLQSATSTVLSSGTGVHSFALWMLKMLTRLALPEALHFAACELFYAASKATGAVARRSKAPGALRAPVWLSGGSATTSIDPVSLNIDWATDGLRVTPFQSIEIGEISVLEKDFPSRLLDAGAAFSPDGALIAYCRTPEQISILRHNGEVLAEYHAVAANTAWMSFSRSGDNLYVVTADLTLLKLSIGALHKQVFSIPATNFILCAAFSQYGDTCAVVSEQRELMMLDTGSGDVIVSTMLEEVFGQPKLCFDASGAYLILADDRALLVFKATDLNQPVLQRTLDLDITSLAICPATNRLLVGAGDGTVAMLDTGTLETLQTYQFRNEVFAREYLFITSLAVPASGGWAMAGMSTGEIAIFNIDTGHHIATCWDGNSNIDAIALDHAGKRLVVIEDRVSVADVHVKPAEMRLPENQTSTASVDLIKPYVREAVTVARDEAGWLRITPDGLSSRARTAVTGGLPVRPGPARWLDITAPDGARYRLEDADAAAARAPLLVGVLYHPKDAEMARLVLRDLEEAIRAHAGLPVCAHVICQDLSTQEHWYAGGAERMLERSRGTDAVLVLGARGMADDKDLPFVLRSLAQQTNPSAPKLVVLSHADATRDRLRFQTALDKDYRGAVKFVDPMEANVDANSIPQDAIVSVLLSDSTTQDSVYCRETERLLQDLMHRDGQISPIPIALSEDVSVETIRKQIPSLGSETGPELPPVDDQETSDGFIVAWLNGFAEEMTCAPIYPVWIDRDDMGTEAMHSALPKGWQAMRSLSRLQETAHLIAQRWRLGPDAKQPEAYDDMSATDLCAVMQNLTMMFHLDHFEPRIGARDSATYFHNSTLKRVEALTPESDKALQQKHQFAFLAEYYHNSILTLFLNGGMDPWRQPDLATFENQLHEFIYPTLKRSVTRPPGLLPNLQAIFEGFAQHALPHERGELLRVLSEYETRTDGQWEKVLSDPETVQRIERFGLDRLARLLRPYAVAGMNHYSHVLTAERPPLTIVEEVERYQGRFLEYLSAIEQANPATAALIDQEGWEELRVLPQREAFNSLRPQFEEVAPSSSPKEPVRVPIATFHDIAAILSEEIIRHVRHRAGQAARDTTDTYSAAQA